MSNGARAQRGHQLPSFEGEAQAFEEQERAGTPAALALAVSAAAFAAGEYLAEHALGTMTFEVTKISVVVSENPGPTTYRAIISAGG